MTEKECLILFYSLSFLSVLLLSIVHFSVYPDFSVTVFSKILGYVLTAFIFSSAISILNILIYRNILWFIKIKDKKNGYYSRKNY